MSKWEKVRLGDVAEVVSGSTPKTSVQDYWNGELNWVTPAELTEDKPIIYETERKITEQAVKDTGLKLLPIGTVLLSSRAPIGKVAIAGAEMYCNQGFKNLICSKDLDNKYLFWYLKGKTNYLNSLGRGATFKEISKKIVENIKIPLPPIDKQQGISKLLDITSKLVSKHKQQLTELDNLIKSIFYDMFGDPVVNEKGWERFYLPEVMEIIDGDRGVNYPKQEDFLDRGHCLFLNTGNVTKNGFSFSNVKFISETKDNQLRKGKLVRGDVIMTTRGTIGNIAYYDERVPFDNVRINSGMVILRRKSNLLSQVFFCDLMRNDDMIHEIESFKSGTAQPQLPIRNMKKIKIPLPPLSLQNEFADIVAKIEEQKEQVKRAIEQSQLLFDSLMSKYFVD